MRDDSTASTLTHTAHALFTSPLAFPRAHAPQQAGSLQPRPLCRHRNDGVGRVVTVKLGSLPTSFLRGCGAPDSVIGTRPRCSIRPSSSTHAFISYSSREEI